MEAGAASGWHKFNFWGLAPWSALFVALGLALLCAGASPGVLECRPPRPQPRGSGTATATIPIEPVLTHEPRPGECVVRAGFAFEGPLAWLAPSLHNWLRDRSVSRFAAQAFQTAQGEGPVMLVLDDQQTGSQTLLPVHPWWTVSSQYGDKVAKRINEHFLHFRNQGMGFVYTERPNMLFITYGCILLGAGIVLPLLALCIQQQHRRKASTHEA